MTATRNDDSITSSAGPAIAYSPTIAVPENDPLLARLKRAHGNDPARAQDDLTGAIAIAIANAIANAKREG